MGKHAEIRDSLAAFAGKYAPLQTMVATVKNVNEAAFTCTLLDDDDNEFIDVQLRSVITENESETFYPVAGSYALALRIEDTENWVLIACDKMYKKRMVVETAIYQLTADGHLIQKGDVTMLTAITKVIQAVQQITVLYGNNPDYAKLAEALNDFQNLLQ